MIRFALPLALAAISSSAALAHDFVLKPLSGRVAEGQVLAVQALLTEVYFKGDVVLPVERVQLDVLAKDGKQRVALAPNTGVKALEGTLPAPTAKTFVLVGQTTPRYRSKTPEGDKPVPKTAPGASDTQRSEAFSKALINLAASDDGWSTTVGTRLEIVPLANPAALPADGTFRVKVLFDGKPLATKVAATHDGFSTKDETYAVTTESGADGIASIKVAKPGVLWVVRARHALAENTPERDRYSALATLVFQPN